MAPNIQQFARRVAINVDFFLKEKIVQSLPPDIRQPWYDEKFCLLDLENTHRTPLTSMLLLQTDESKMTDIFGEAFEVSTDLGPLLSAIRRTYEANPFCCPYEEIGYDEAKKIMEDFWKTDYDCKQKSVLNYQLYRMTQENGHLFKY